jgi:ribosome-associated protein
MITLTLSIILLQMASTTIAWMPYVSYQSSKLSMIPDMIVNNRNFRISSRLFVEEVGEVLDVSEDFEMVRTIAKAGDGRKACDIVGMQVAQISTLTSFMVFMSGNSRPQNQAIAAAIVEQMNDEFGILRSPQGTAESGWMILDYGSVMVHIMTPKSRLFYNVEGQVSDKFKA